MAIMFNSKIYQNIIIDSKTIIGVMGDNYHEFLKSLQGDQVYYVNKKIVELKNNDSLKKHLEELHLDKRILTKKLDELSHSEYKLLGYLQMLMSDAKIIVIDEPFMDLDYSYKKTLISLFHRLVKNKTIIIGSTDSNIIYSLCKKVLLLGTRKYLYDDISVLTNKKVLKTYHLEMPQLAEFVRLSRDKKINLTYLNDVRDLIKDVYRHASKK